MNTPTSAIVQSGLVRTIGALTSTHNKYARNNAESGGSFLETRPPSNPPITFAIPNAANIHATR